MKEMVTAPSSSSGSDALYKNTLLTFLWSTSLCGIHAAVRTSSAEGVAWPQLGTISPGPFQPLAQGHPLSLGKGGKAPGQEEMGLGHVKTPSCAHNTSGTADCWIRAFWAQKSLSRRWGKWAPASPLVSSSVLRPAHWCP